MNDACLNDAAAPSNASSGAEKATVRSAALRILLDGRGLPHALVHDAPGPLSGVTTASRARGRVQQWPTRHTGSL